MPTCLDVPKLRSIAAAHGDQTRYAIYRRTGLAESTVHRMIAGQTEPTLPTLRRIASAYGVSVTDLLVSDDVMSEAA